MRGNDLEGFRVLDAIDLAGTLAGAAEKLGKTVPTVGYRLTQLEQSYGIEMLDRSGYRLKLTDQGKRLLEEARKLMSLGEYLDSVAEQLRFNWEPELELVMDGMLDPAIVLNVIRQIAATGAPTNFRLATEYLRGVHARFNQHAADIMFSLEYSEQNDCINHHLFDIDVVLVASPSTGLMAKQKYSFADMDMYTEVSVRDTSYDAPTAGRSLGVSRLFFVGDFYTKKRALLDGMGFGWMPLTWVQPELDDGTLVEVKYEAGSRDTYPVYVGTRKTRYLGKALQKFIDLMQDSFA